MTKVMTTIAYRMRDEGHPSRRNAASSEIWAQGGGDNDDVMRVLGSFSTSPVRCKLVLKLEDGTEISLYPSLKPEVPALGEDGCSEYWSKDPEERGPSWDMHAQLTLPDRKPLYHMIVNGNSSWLPIQQAGVAYDNNWVPVKIGKDVIEADGSVRPITDAERAQIVDIADEYSASK